MRHTNLRKLIYKDFGDNHMTHKMYCVILN